MDSMARLATNGSRMAFAEHLMTSENKKLSTDEKKRKLLSYAPRSAPPPTPLFTFLNEKNGKAGEVPPPPPPPQPQQSGTYNFLDSTDSTIGTFGDLQQQTDDVKAQGVDQQTATAQTIKMSIGAFEQTGHFFLRHAGQDFSQKFFELANKFEILNSEGILIGYAGETLECFGREKSCFGTKSPTFDACVIAQDGTPLINLTSQKGITTVSDFHRVFGSIIDVGTIFAPHERFSVRDWNMCEIFKLKKANNGPKGEFDIFDKENKRVGVFSNNWSFEMSNYVGIDKLYGISIPNDMAVEEKTILLGALFTLYFHHLHDDTADDNGKFYAYCLCIFAGICFMTAVITVVLWAVLRH